MPDKVEEKNKRESMNKKNDRGSKRNLNDIRKQFSKIEEKEKSVREKMNEKRKKVEEVRTKLIKNLFSLLKDVGVDPSNQEDIDSFLTSLRAKDPDLLELFETAFDGLLEAEVAEAQGEEGGKEGERGGEGSLVFGKEEAPAKEEGEKKRANVPSFPSLSGLAGGEENADVPEPSAKNPARRAMEGDGQTPVRDFKNIMAG